jgi:hypothetical protein
MRRVRFTIAQSMAAVLVIAFGFAALRNANETWASATHTLSIVMVTAAGFGACVRKGRRRVTLAAFAVFGWAYLLVSRLPDLHLRGLAQVPAPTMLFEWGILQMHPFFDPAGVADTVAYVQISHSVGIILFASVGAVLGYFLAAKDEMPIS